MKKKWNSRKMATLQVQVKQIVTYTDAVSQITNFKWKADNEQCL